MIKELLEQKNGNHVSSGRFNISKIGTCKRQIYLEMKKLYKQEFSEDLLRTFSIGDVVHRNMINEIISKGHLDGIHITATEIDVGNDFISGRIDMLVSDGKDNFVCDIKSAGNWTINKVLDGEISEAYKNQVLLYEYFSGIHKGILVFVGKEKGQILEVEVLYNKEKAEELIKDIENFFINNINKNIIPEKCDGGDFGCKVCEEEDDYWLNKVS